MGTTNAELSRRKTRRSKPILETIPLSDRPWFIVEYKSRFAKNNIRIQADNADDAKARVRIIFPKYEVL